ncbi:oligoendopeptidase F [Cyclonatronum proteinivorum]|uniref:Oligoendopeptidase F n=1 Tax=Cyclonatronum proteinivorum TaxID=1457365 RepID=A0A345UN28_9BACT|nr:M3 family oligoendopeptidase [Cyclonatronum proteinivorum]AXJ01880.1 oligoendopeptidase F [Cyclonatronum proteinivorum]
MSKAHGAESIHWDLSDLYEGPNDPSLIRDMDGIIARADSFASQWKGRIASLSPAEFREALQAYEGLMDLGSKIGSYAYLNWSTNTEDAALGKLLQQSSELGSELNQKLVFFDLEWLALEETEARKHIDAPELAFYRHYLISSRKYKPHMLSEAEEKILSAKSVTGARSWVRFFDETLGAARFTFEGEPLTEQQVLSKMHAPERETRQKAAASLTAGFRELSRPLTFIFNTLLADKSTNDKLRGYPSWVTSRNLSNEIKDETVDALVEAVTEAYPLVQRYYRLKTKLLGLDEMRDYDRYAPLAQNETVVSWQEARKMVLDAYSGFHPKMGEVAGYFFEHNWIDAAIRPGKRGGAYSASTAASVHPYVFMNYDGRVRDVQTLAHELGHGVHQYLSRERGPLQAGTPLTTAETASVFGEMLVFRDLMGTLTDPKERLALLCSKIDDSIATVFRQISMNRFENAIHTARREKGELTTQQFSELWMETQTALYGDSVKLSDDYGIWWSYIPHFLHSPGYVYAYAFGELLVLSLYEQYRTQPQGFADRYLELLHAGGSESPEALTARMGVDINDKAFWQAGVALIGKLIDEAESLAAEVQFGA